MPARIVSGVSFICSEIVFCAFVLAAEPQLNSTQLNWPGIVRVATVFLFPFCCFLLAWTNSFLCGPGLSLSAGGNGGRIWHRRRRTMQLSHAIRMQDEGNSARCSNNAHPLAHSFSHSLARSGGRHVDKMAAASCKANKCVKLQPDKS